VALAEVPGRWRPWRLRAAPQPEVGAQIKKFKAQAQIAQPKILIGKTQAQIAQVKNKIGKTQAQIAQTLKKN